MWWALRKDNVLKLQEREPLGEFAENELRVGLSMGSDSIDFSYVLKLQERERLGEFAKNELRMGLSMGSKSI
eukprot:8907362-Karenia_brevis.AAC.1